MRRVLLAVAVFAMTALVVPVAGADRGHSRSHGRSDEHHGGDHSAGPVTYAVIGDTPYGLPQIENFQNDVGEINADPKVRLVMHLGDIKNGSTECTTSYFEQIRADFNGFDNPLVYTPGDNEWTDCHRANNGGYWPAGPVLNGDSRPARLAEIHRIFFDHPGWSLGQHPQRVETQGGNYVENITWSRSDVQFGDLNVPGSNNDWLPWFGQPQTKSQIDEVNGRIQADILWLDRIFDEARDEHAKAVAIGIQADMWDPAIEGDPTQYDHFQPIVQALAHEALSFRGPVLLMNGDSHQFVDDYPLADPSRPQNKSIYGITQDVPNLHRITVNGSTTPCHEWLKLTIDPHASGVFSYQRMPFSKQPGFDHTICPEK
jgi:calcineurin-like phosphoesterase family protein